MRRVSVASALLIALSWCASVVAQTTPYNTSDTFQPGRKYNCVPTADRKGWECNEIGKAEKPARGEASNESPPSPPASPAQETKPISAAPAQPPSQPNSDRSSSLPSYLTNAAASSTAAPTPPPSTISATANHANEPPIQSAAPSPPPSKPPVLAAKPAPVAPPKTAPAVVAKPVVPKSRPASSAPPKPSVPARETSRPTIPANGDFMALTGDRFVIELAHASRQSDLATSRDAMHVPRGDFYEVHLRQNGADAWLLLWGTFDTIEAARSARSELAQGASATVGWPRRVAPLQAEARRISE